MRVPRLLCLLFSAQLLASSCGETPSPTAPSAANPPSVQGPVPTPTGESIRGFVTDTAGRPVGGARVEVVDGPSAGSAATADVRGEFSLSGTFDESTQFRATGDGHAPAVARLASSCSTCVPRRWLYFTLDLLTAPARVEGLYLLTVMADPACTALPEIARIRVFEVRVQPSVVRPATGFDVLFGGAALIDGYRTAWLSVAGDYVALAMGDWHDVPDVVERLGDTTYVGFDGGGAASIGADRLGTFDAPFEGVVEYCELPEPMGERYACNPPAGFTHVACTSRNHRVIMARR
jgi:hypothetical protein